ncbi:hypothetical protein J1605_008222 [Eschrichtius robustus]|uniref:SCAN box domain-containing protein n=1 Tax=Eschrichtius robustus TaxID=9764 RepID=A0AB34H1B5_ESCRO|nr:hypothetical protein J1605_008222 [Eschrichtius robustus]
MLRSAERPAERGGEGGGPSTGKVRAGTGAAAQRDRERRTGAWVPPVARPSAVARGSSITARCHGDRIWSPRPQLPWRHPDLPRLPKAEGARPGFCAASSRLSKRIVTAVLIAAASPPSSPRGRRWPQSPSLLFPMRPTALGSPGHAPPEDEGPITVKLEESEEEGEAAPWDPGPEAARQRFRHFRYEEAVGPREALARLRELCRQWLRPEVHSKEQVLELLVLEQFLGALPAEIQARVRGQQPGSPEEAAALVEGLRREPGGPRRWVTVQVQGQEVLSEKTEPSDFQPLPQVTPRAPEPGLEMPHGATQESSLGLRVKEEPGVTEDPELLDSGPLTNPQEATSTVLPAEAQGCGVALDQASPHSEAGPEGSSWTEHPEALWQEEAGSIFSPGE